jgi:capsular polysaccharide transport system ATP-binding protein
MIILDKVTKGSGTAKGSWGPLSLAIPTNRSIALLGPSEMQKQYLIDVIGGSRLPDQGAVIRKVRVSFPVGRLPGFDRTITIRRNVEHIARLYGANIEDTVAVVRHVVAMGDRFDALPGRSEKLDTRVLGEAVAFAIPFDFYVLVSDRIQPGALTWELFQARQRTSGMLIPTADPEFAIENCDMAIVLYQSDLALFEHVSQALEFLVELERKVGPQEQA